MANGRIVAQCAGETATGAFTCVVRRASFPHRRTYRLDFVNDGDAAAEITVALGECRAQTMTVAAHGSSRSWFDVPRSAGGLALTVACDGAMFAAQERVRSAAFRRRRLLVIAAVSTSFAAVAVTVASRLVWFVRQRRRSRRVDEGVDEFRGAAPAAPAPEPTLITLSFEAEDEFEYVPPPDDPVVAVAIDETAIEEPGETAVHIEHDDDDGLDDIDAAELEPEREHEREPEPGDELPVDAAAAQQHSPVIEVLEPEPVRVTPLRPDRATYIAHPRHRGTTGTLFATALVTGCAIAGFVYAHPHVGDLGAPNTVLEGSAIDVPFTTSGLGSLRYTVIASNGTAVAGGPLAQPSGVLHIAIPSVHHNEAYRIRLVKSGPLGDASNEATVGANAIPVARVVTRAASVPIIRSFAVSTGIVDKVPTVTAFYDVIADSGTLRIVVRGQL